MIHSELTWKTLHFLEVFLNAQQIWPGASLFHARYDSLVSGMAPEDRQQKTTCFDVKVFPCCRVSKEKSFCSTASKEV